MTVLTPGVTSQSRQFGELAKLTQANHFLSLGSSQSKASLERLLPKFPLRSSSILQVRALQ